MAARSRARGRASRTQLGGLLLAVAGALMLLAFLTPYIGVTIDGSLLNLLFHIAIAVGFGFLAATNLGSIRGAFAIAAIGWGIRIVAIFISLGPLVSLGDLLAAVGGIVGAALLLSASGPRKAGPVTLLVATILGLMYVLPALVAFLPGAFLSTVPPLFGLALLVAGILMLRR